MAIDTFAKQMYDSCLNHRAVYKELLRRGFKTTLLEVMLWCDLISPEQWVRIQMAK
jgi:hypothetical protein